MIGKTAVAARLLRYTEKEKAGGTEPRVLYSEGIRCRVPTAEREFAAVRRAHGKQGAKRKAPAKYKLPEPGEVATYTRRVRPNGRKYWAVAEDRETATHVRREGDGYVDEIQAVHVIVSYGLDEVNPDDPEQVRLAFEFVGTMITGLYPGVQMKLVGQADGAGKAFHVHVVQNAVVVERMEVDGQIWEAGRKMSGALTDIGRLRERADEFVSQHGAEYGVEQKLPSVATQKAENRSTRDRRMAAKGEISNHDIIRAAFEDSMNDARSVDLDGFVGVMSEHDVTVNHRVTRAGKSGEKHALSYRLDDMKTPVRGTTLGEHFAFESTVQQLEANASGEERERRPDQHHAGAPKQLSMPTAQELADAQAVVERLAREEREAQADDQADADFFPAFTEDFDAAVEAERLGDFTELARLANATREKEAQRRTQQAQTSAISGPEAKVQAQPVIAPGQGQPEQSATAPVPGGVSISGLPDAKRVQEAALIIPKRTIEPDVAATIPKAQTTEEDGTRLREINERNQRLGLPLVSPERHAANQAMTPELRKRRLEHPEWFDDTEPAAKPSNEGRSLGD
ncbi:hypothetical protein [Glaciibacter sp. 2TAF33]|uniref:hypothetical protein n=1 Tax=Glaciibacter sp. 2TAF33 TaxID=3233015 RepID=UPI003F90CF74